jgi:hypothetical protein
LLGAGGTSLVAELASAAASLHHPRVRAAGTSAAKGSALAVLLGGALLGAGLLAVACGPSSQAIYEGNVRFEHCYRLDLDLNIVPTHREACWKQWLTTYTYGQPRDRIEYARRRLHAFSVGDVSRPVLDTKSQQSERREYYLVVPEPTSVRAPPPAIAEPVPSATTALAAPSGSAAAEAPGSACLTACQSAFRSCQSVCAPGVPADAACKSCEPDYKHCAQRCFE